MQPETTLFVVCSKSFKTEETLINAQNAKDWLMKAGAKDLENNFIAITENTKAAHDFNIPAENCLLLPKEVGGRYSIWTSAGLTCALGIGWKTFLEFLSGAEAMDSHFKSATPRKNLPVIKRGKMLAGVKISNKVMEGVVVVSTGSWFSPYKKEQLEIHGNPNVLTGDIPTSSLSQAPTAHTTLVEVKKMSKKYNNLKTLLYDFSHL